MPDQSDRDEGGLALEETALEPDSGRGRKTAPDGVAAREGEERHPPHEVRPGDRIGRFSVLEELGQGGMGVVVSAYDAELDRRVALKLLRPEGQAPEAGRARLLREAQAMARLRHPNVVQVYEVGTAGDRIFVAMEYVEHGSLPAKLEALRREKPLPWKQILELFTHAGRGLAAAHRAGLVHRDFKPDNVLVGEDGRVQVTDFGLVGTAAEALATEAPAVSPDSPLGARLTEAGAVLGTPIYMSPEQHRGGEVDARADQFAFCVALYEALYGRLPFPDGSKAQYIDALTEGDVLSPPAGAAPLWIHRVLRRGLDPDPDARYPSMDALLEELDVDPEREARIGAGTRMFVFACLGLIWTVTPLLHQLFRARLEALGFARLYVFGVSMTALVAFFGLWARETVSRTAYNRRLGALVLFTMAAQIPLVLGGELAGLAPPQVELHFLLLWFTSAACGAITIDRRFWPAALAYLVAFLVAGWDKELIFFAMAGGNAVLTADVLYVWRPRAERGAADPQFR